jgi:hypothetical protein
MYSKKRSTTVSPRENAFTIAPSPLNGVKFELGVVIVIGVLLLLIQGRITSNTVIQLLLLVGYGILGMGWIMVRTRQVVVKTLAERARNPDGSQ